MKCLLLDIEMPIGNICPAPYNDEGLLCYEGCGLADNPELLDEKVKNWKKFRVDIMKNGNKNSDKNNDENSKRG